MISACLIAKNEEKWIGDCLEHLKALASEIVVVDTGSTDRTIEIAREKGARVSQIKWENDFAKARNASLDRATGRWILIIDPDERLAARDIEKMRALVEAKNIVAYSFNTRNYSDNPVASGFSPCKGEYEEEKQYPGYFESRKVRLFQNIPSIRFVGTVHELVESTIKGTIVASDIPFHHYGSTKEVTQEKKKHDLYRAQGQKKIQEQPHDWKAYFELGVEFLTEGNPAKAVKELEKAHQLKPKDPLIMSNLGYAYLETGKLDQSARVLDECLGFAPKHHDTLLNRGVVEMRRNRWADAITSFQRLVDLHPKSFTTWRNIGLCYAHLKNYQKAAEAFEKALKVFPQYHEARIDLGVVCFAGGRADLAKIVLQEALKHQPQSMRARVVLEDVEKTLAQGSGRSSPKAQR